MSCRFYLGTHRPGWLWDGTAVPLCVSEARLGAYRGLAPATCDWILDSGGFTEITKHGAWTVAAHAYARRIRRYLDEVGRLAWAAPQDWVCSPEALARSGLPVEEHQRRTVASTLELRDLLGSSVVVPVLQGATAADYEAHADQYARAGVALEREPVVGVGSIVTRQKDREILDLLARLAARGLRIHAFGFKGPGLEASAESLASADSMAWSFRGRRVKFCTSATHRNCANCKPYALHWRAGMLANLTGRVQ